MNGDTIIGSAMVQIVMSVAVGNNDIIIKDVHLGIIASKR